MKVGEAEQMLGNSIARVKEQTVGNLLRTMTDFLRDVRFQTLPLAEDGDGLLLQWGTYDWGQGRAFEFDLTRQFFVAGDQEPCQLSMTMRFAPTPALASLSASNCWCFRLDELRGFEEFMMSSPPYKALATREPESLEIRFEEV